ncbi:NAD-dependent DNA ligase [Acanthamoeba polyphaga moumouvirus]|uniref:DNA ligase (NAD(+)) n=1 Tax=Acanthamoeba polyphaga moumouvirus TaxID=1269028 RepID=L7RCP5_9VIRU|nr:NAD-dependent DNA ligase [Acanthamoeba polyphaga moumouvirus]AGC02062.1 NAD-dependent DNA ligase [Acanthamoeba polyphaga moumouvirus]AQN68428.1 NAD-dependent DNA ligase [Saudi moumouvirus]
MDIIKKINEANSIWEIIPELDKDEIENVIMISRDSYYNSGKSLISDEYYDILLDRLQELDPESELLNQVGAPIRGKKVKLPYWMGSMNKIKSDEKLINNWVKKYRGPYVISDKLDGISCLLVFANSKIKLYTRGDGNYGQDISHLVDLVNMSVENLYNSENDISIRGELIMTKKNFLKYSDIMSNARNMVSGIVNSKKESVNKKYARDVDFVAYELIKPTKKPSDQLKQLTKLGLNVVYYDIYKDINIEILDNILQKRKTKSKYEIDGIIVTDNNKYTRNKSGNPDYSFAYKGVTETADVKVIEVIWTPSKDGILVPRIHFQKVRLSQADLEYTTGFNAKFIKDNKIGPGAIISIVRSGDVIPYITDVVKPAKEPSLPKNVDYVWDKNKVNIILANFDENEIVIIQRLTKFMKDIGVENLSQGIVTRLVEAGYDNIPKIMSMTVDDFLSLEGFQERLANKLYNNLQNSINNLDVLTLMNASNIFGRGFGEKKLKKILDAYPDIVLDYKQSDHNKWRNKILSLEGFDDITTDSFLKSLPEFQKFYKIVNKIVDIKPYTSNVKKTGMFQNQNIVFTGFRNKDWQKFIEEEGGKVSGSVSKNTTLLVYNDGEESSNKYQTAKKLGIKTISKSQFAKKYNI